MMQYPMTRKQYREALEEFGLTQGRAAWLFNGKSVASGRRWAAEGAPYHVALIITMMRELKLHPDDIEEYGRKWRKKRTA
jgi:hypothetical protein